MNQEPNQEPNKEHNQSKKPNQTRKRKIIVSSKSPLRYDNPLIWNNKFADILGQLSDLETKKGEQYKARAYKKAQETIISFPNNITSIDQLQDQPNIGKSIITKLIEFM